MVHFLSCCPIVVFLRRIKIYNVTITAKTIIKLPKSKQLKLNFLKWIGAFFFSEATRLISILRLANSSSLSPLRWR